MRRKTQQILCMALGLILLVSTALTGCAVKDPVAQDVLNNSLTAMAKTTSYKVDFSMTWNMEMTGGTEPGKMTMDMTGNGVTEIKTKNTHINLDINADYLGQNEKLSMEMYSVDPWQYIKMSGMGQNDQWTKLKSTSSSALSSSLSQGQIDELTTLMKSSTKSTLTTNEKLNGINCYVLEIEPDLAALWQWMMSQQAESLSSGVDFSKMDLSKIIQSFGVKYWIAKKNFQIIKADANMTMALDAATLGLSTDESGSMTMSMLMSASFSDYNKPVTIEVPAEALNANDVSQ
jgi:hypothetical protein